MDAEAAAADASVRAVLLRVEEKLYESGALVTATGDSEAEVTLAFENVLVGKEQIFAMVVRVASGRAARIRRSRLQALSGDALRCYAMLQTGLPEEVRGALLDCAGPVVLLNGEMAR